MMKHSFLVLIILFFIGFISCDNQNKKKINNKYTDGFSIEQYEGFKLLYIHSPWKNAQKSISYLLIDRGTPIPNNIDYNYIIRTPIKKVVITSTTHIPTVELLNVSETVVGMTGTIFASSEIIRKRIDSGEIQELGLSGSSEGNGRFNIEKLIELQPDAIIGSTISGNNPSYKNIQNAGITIVFNGEWTSKSPLGRSEWIKLFGALYHKEALADSLFNQIENNYIKAKNIAKNIVNRPTIISGALYKDIWYVPGGNSWSAQLFRDAGGTYLWGNTKDTGSIPLNFEKVFEKGIKADYWIGPNQYTSYAQLKNSFENYKLFKPFGQKTIYTYYKTKGATGGLLYYELGPNRPDILLMDLISILHPNLMQNHKKIFYKPLDD